MNQIPAARSLLNEAKAVFAEMVEIEGEIRKDYERLFVASWWLGQKLCALKDAVGHGGWLFWLGANWKELSARKAQLCMQFFKKNDQLREPSVDQFDAESVRVLLWGYMPEKARTKLPGDKSLPPARHHLTAVNQIVTWSRRVETGLVTPPEIAVLRRDFEQPLRRLITLLGPDWVRDLAAPQ